MSAIAHICTAESDTSQWEAQSIPFLPDVSNVELSELPRRIREGVNRSITHLPHSLWPNAHQSFEVLRWQAPAFQAIPSILSNKYVCKMTTPRLCLGYPVSSQGYSRLECALKLDRRKAADRGIAIDGVCRHIEQEIQHRVRRELVWFEGQDIWMLSLCSNWDMSRQLDQIVPKLREILGEGEDPKWYLDVWHSKWS
ncbi:hypothetical protein OBBRIDRAFT_826562 [Obba rivulosa]|uniref:Uncharacterized protein n=1 Tax=Obba rivulosa TaxID=1052685 RepID=A0A8E2AWL8_9APHY|nr:hypothetical protein OBBRIDRAFT_826562 [Obba rivulosa]